MFFYMFILLYSPVRHRKQGHALMRGGENATGAGVSERSSTSCIYAYMYSCTPVLFRPWPVRGDRVDVSCHDGAPSPRLRTVIFLYLRTSVSHTHSCCCGNTCSPVHAYTTATLQSARGGRESLRIFVLLFGCMRVILYFRSCRPPLRLPDALSAGRRKGGRHRESARQARTHVFLYLYTETGPSQSYRLAVNASCFAKRSPPVCLPMAFSVTPSYSATLREERRGATAEMRRGIHSFICTCASLYFRICASRKARAFPCCAADWQRRAALVGQHCPQCGHCLWPPMSSLPHKGHGNCKIPFCRQRFWRFSRNELRSILKYVTIE